MDRDAVYINLPKHKIGFTKQEDEDENVELPEAVSLVRELQQKVGALNDASSKNKLQLTNRSSKVLANKSLEQEEVESKVEDGKRERRLAPKMAGAGEVSSGAESDDDDLDEEDDLDEMTLTEVGRDTTS